MSSDWKEDSLRHKYDPLPEDGPRHRKRARKVHVRSDHRHDYERVCVDDHSRVFSRGEERPLYTLVDRCRVCGRVGNTRRRPELREPPEGMPLYEVEQFETWFMRVLPEDRRVR